jgi:hypothetical protein
VGDFIVDVRVRVRVQGRGVKKRVGGVWPATSGVGLGLQVGGANGGRGGSMVRVTG